MTETQIAHTARRSQAVLARDESRATATAIESLFMQGIALSRVETRASKLHSTAVRRLARTKEQARLGRLFGKSLLEMCAVQAPTALDYTKRMEMFTAWLRQKRLTPATLEEMDAAIVKYFDNLFYSGIEVSEGSKTMAAVQHLWPHAKGRLPRGWRAIKGWSKLAPPRTRLPLPWVGLMALIGAALHQGFFWEAFAMLLQFVCYLRPGELLNLKHANLMAPARAAGPGGRWWGLILGDHEMGRAAKSGEFDESVQLDRDDLPELTVLHGMHVQSHLCSLFQGTLSAPLLPSLRTSAGL